MADSDIREGRFTLSHWATFISAIVQQSDRNQTLRQMFRQLDRSSTGRISRNDWIHAVKHSMPRTAAAKASDAFDMLLRNGTEALDSATFVSCMLQRSHPHDSTAQP